MFETDGIMVIRQTPSSLERYILYGHPVIQKEAALLICILPVCPVRVFISRTVGHTVFQFW